VKHEGRQHARTDQGKVEPGSVMGEKGHEIAKIPEDIGKADEEEDNVGDSSGSADGQKNGKDEVDEDNDQGDIRVDRQDHLLHR